jgi:uncharacterized Tic20 family protein
MLILPVVAPLIMWLVKRDQSPFIDDHGREAVNFQISITLYALATIPLGIVTCGAGYVIGWIAVVVLAIIGMITGAIAAHQGRYFRYPATIRLVK